MQNRAFGPSWQPCIGFSDYNASTTVRAAATLPAGYRITACAATADQAAFVMSAARRAPADETQETLRTSAFPSVHIKVLPVCQLLACSLHGLGSVACLPILLAPVKEGQSRPPEWARRPFAL
jgi:hypothetical protein